VRVKRARITRWTKEWKEDGRTLAFFSGRRCHTLCAWKHTSAALRFGPLSHSSSAHLYIYVSTYTHREPPHLLSSSSPCRGATSHRDHHHAPLVLMNAADAAHLRCLAGLAPSAFFPPEPHHRHRDHENHLCRLVRAEDPLVSHVASSILLKALRLAAPGSSKGCLTEVLSPYPSSSGPAKFERRRLTNALEACRRVVEEVCCPEVDPELRGEEGEGEEEEGGAGSFTCKATKAYVQQVVARALPGWQEAALQSYVASAAAVQGIDAEEEEDVELPLVWVVKVGLVLRRSYYEVEEDDEEQEQVVEEEVERDLANTLLLLCQACWGTIERVGIGGVEARRQVLELALALLREVEGDAQNDDHKEDGEEREKAEKEVIEGLMTLVCCATAHLNSTRKRQRDDEEEEEAETPSRRAAAAAAAVAACSLVRPLRESDLFNTRMALWTKLTRRVVQRRNGAATAAAGAATASAAKDSSSTSSAEEWEFLLLRLLQSPLCQAHFGVPQAGGEGGGGGGEQGHERESQRRLLLVEQLAEDDSKLMGVLHDLLLIHWGLRMHPLSSNERGRFLPPFLAASDPPALLSALLEKLPDGSAEQLFLDFLLSNETCALEYMVRITKFIAWRQHNQHQRPQQQQQQQQQVQEQEQQQIVRAFLQRLCQRLESLAKKHLLLFDPSALLARLQQLQEAPHTFITQR